MRVTFGRLNNPARLKEVLTKYVAHADEMQRKAAKDARCSAADPAWTYARVALLWADNPGEFVKLGFEQDVAIWRTKTRIDNPFLVEEDGPVYQLRRWYEQFYVDAADVTPVMVDRFESEIDTTRPIEHWNAEVEANLAAGRVP